MVTSKKYLKFRKEEFHVFRTLIIACMLGMLEKLVAVMNRDLYVISYLDNKSYRIIAFHMVDIKHMIYDNQTA